MYGSCKGLRSCSYNMIDQMYLRSMKAARRVRRASSVASMLPAIASIWQQTRVWLSSWSVITCAACHVDVHSNACMRTCEMGMPA